MASSGDLKHGRGLMEILGHAVIDPTFRKKVFEEPDKLAKEYNLSPQDTEALKNIDRAKIEGAASQVKETSEFAISIVIRGHFDTKA
jgi:hypothetical protein